MQKHMIASDLANCKGAVSKIVVWRKQMIATERRLNQSLSKKINRRVKAINQFIHCEFLNHNLHHKRTLISLLCIRKLLNVAIHLRMRLIWQAWEKWLAFALQMLLDQNRSQDSTSKYLNSA
jgi:hypothetical protein